MTQSSQPRSPRRQEPTAKERLTGLLLIVIVAIIWIAASFVVQELRLHPFLITYICNILFVVYIPVAAMQDIKRCYFLPMLCLSTLSLLPSCHLHRTTVRKHLPLPSTWAQHMLLLSSCIQALRSIYFDSTTFMPSKVP